METMEPREALAGAIELILEAVGAGAYIAIETLAGGLDVPDAGEPLGLTASGTAILAAVNGILSPARLLVWRHDPDLNPPDGLRKESVERVNRNTSRHLLGHGPNAEAVRGDDPVERRESDCGSDGLDSLSDVVADGGSASDVDLGGHASIDHPYRQNVNNFDQFARPAMPTWEPPSVKTVLR